MDVKISKTRVNAKTRKLKATWTVERSEDFFFPTSNKLTLADDASKEFKYGLNASRCSFKRLYEIKDWLLDTFDASDVEFTGDCKELIWFKHDKMRTLTLLKWTAKS